MAIFFESCACGGRFIVECGMKICTSCGSSSSFLGNPQNNFGSPSTVLTKSIVYDRRYRFSTHLCRLGRRLYNAPSIDDGVWKVLEEAKPKNVKEILSCLRRTGKISNKHYSQLSTFSKVFLKDEIPSMSKDEYDRIMFLFDAVHNRWKKKNIRSFFSYNWLLQKFICDTPMQRFLPVLKLLKCAKRRQKYNQKLDDLFKDGFLKFKDEANGSVQGVLQDHQHGLRRNKAF